MPIDIDSLSSEERVILEEFIQKQRKDGFSGKLLKAQEEAWVEGYFSGLKYASLATATFLRAAADEIDELRKEL